MYTCKDTSPAAMGGVSMVAAFLLFCSLTARGTNSSTPTACQPVVNLQYECTITPENRQEVLSYIKLDNIESVIINITEKCRNFVFANDSFSKDLKHLVIQTFSPLRISSGAFRGSEGLISLQILQKYDSLTMDSKDANISQGQENWTSVQLEPGWLNPLTRLTDLYLSLKSIERFPDGQFCHLKKLNQLIISNNRINSLGITCNNVNEPCSPCLPSLEDLRIGMNPIKNLNLNISYHLPNLNVLSLTGGSLTSIHIGPDMSHFSHLKVLTLTDSRLHSIAAGLFRFMNHLDQLDLSNNSLSEESLITAGLNNLTELTSLTLSYNNISTLSADLIGNMLRLKLFDCRECELRQIEKDSFVNLQYLSYLLLGGNRLQSIDGQTFSHLKSIINLDLSHNLLVAIPVFPTPIRTLNKLSLDGNHITEIGRVSGLSYVGTLSLASNQIHTIHVGAFSKMGFLNELNLNNNSLTVLKYTYFSDIHLRVLQLNNNSLDAYPLLIKYLSYLEAIDISWNNISTVHVTKSDTLAALDLSHNMITKFDISLSDMKQLQQIDLRYNRLTTLREEDFVTTQGRPLVLLEGNPLHCDCQAEWLLKTKHNSPFHEKKRGNLKQTKNGRVSGNVEYHERFYAQVLDIDTLQCSNSSSGSFTSEVSTVDFVCPYTEECIPLHCENECCKEDPDCPCNVFCYPGCTCYHKRNHEVDYMNCTSRDITNLPHRGPAYVKQIYLDGNNLTTLSSDHLNFSLLTDLFVNYSNVFNVQAGAFEKLKALTTLDLHQNHLQAIGSNTFRNLFYLKRLYLQDNQIHSIDENSFTDLPHLMTLKLHGNNLKYINLSLFKEMNNLKDLTLHGNPWFCDCEFGQEFQKWLTRNSDIVKDLDHIYCMKNTLYTELNGYKNRGTRSTFNNTNSIIDINFSYVCNNSIHIRSITEVASLAAAFAALILIVIVVYINRLLIKVWVYNRFGVRFQCKGNDDVDKPYDVFLMYPRQEDRFVVQHLLPQLEDGDMSYRICLEGRDWPAAGDRSETIIASVQQSKRTILLITEDHFNDQWCEFTFEAGHYQVLMDKQIRLIIVLTDKRLKARMNRTMKMYMSTNAFLVVGEKWFWKKLRYFLADNPRGSDSNVGREYTPLEVYIERAH